MRMRAVVLVAVCASAGVANAATKAKAKAKPGVWTVETTTSPIDDTKTVVLSVAADNEITGWPALKVRPSLILRCKESNVDVYVVTGMAAAGEETPVTMRLDKREARRSSWLNSTSRDSIFYPDGSASFVGDLAESETLLVELTPFNSSPTLATFKLVGMRKHVAALYTACAAAFAPDPMGQAYKDAANEMFRKAQDVQE